MLLTNDLESIIKLWKVNLFLVGKEPCESIMVLAESLLILSVIPRSLLIACLILSQILSQKL